MYNTDYKFFVHNNINTSERIRNTYIHTYKCIYKYVYIPRNEHIRYVMRI